MLRTKKIMITVLIVITMLCAIVFGITQTKTNRKSVLADEPTVVCQGIANDENNNIPETVAQGNPVPIYRTLLKYDIALGAQANTTNVVSTTGQGILLNGVSLSEIPNVSIDYANGSKYIRIKIPQSYQDALTGNVILEVVERTPFENQYLDDAKFILRNGQWKNISNVSYSGITWNDTGYNYYADKKGVLLNFSGNLSKIQSEIDGGIQSTNFAQSVGEHIYLGGLKLSTLPNAMVSYHSTSLLFIYADNMSAYRTLTIEAGTKVLDASLPEVNLYFIDNSTKWSTQEKTYNTVTYSGITWNDIGYNYYANKNGLLLNFSGNLSKIQSEIDAGIQSTNFAQSVGEHIYLGGKKLSTLPNAMVSYHSTSLLFIYADNMSAYRTLTIEAGTKVLDASLPSVNLFYINGSTKWSTQEKTFTPVTFSGFQWNNIGYDPFSGKNGVLLNFSSNLSVVQSEFNGGIKNNNLVSIIGDKVKLGETALEDIEGAEINYHSLNMLWIYAPNMTTLGNLTIESTSFFDSMLPDLELTFSGSAWSVYVPPVEPTVSYVDVGLYGWNNKLDTVNGTTASTIIKFDKSFGTEDSTNLATSDNELSRSVTIDGVSFYELRQSNSIYAINHQNGGNYFSFIVPTAFLSTEVPTGYEYHTLEIEFGVPYMGEILPSVKLVLKNGQWCLYVPPIEPTVSYVDVGLYGWNNMIDTVNGTTASTIIKFDKSFGDASSTNLALIDNALSRGVTIDGVSFYQLRQTNSIYAINHQNGGNYFSFIVPTAFLSTEVPIGYEYHTLEIESGVPYMGENLPSVKLVLKNGQWCIYQPSKSVSFSSITWNDIGYNFYQDMNGVLLSFSENLSNDSSEYSGGIQSTNFAQTVGEHIYLGGKKLSTLPNAMVSYHSLNLLFIYADNMTVYRTLKIESGTQILDAILPSVNLFYINGSTKWSTQEKTFTPVTFSGFQWNNIGYDPFDGKNGVLLNFSSNLSVVQSEVNGGIKNNNLVSIIGDKVKLGGTALKDITDAEINYHSLNMLWIYAPNMTTLGNLTIESINFLDSTLPDLELTFSGSAWEIYVPVVEPTVSYVDVGLYGWNNMIDTGAGTTASTIIKFDKSFGDKSSTNLATIDNELSRGVTIDGVSFYQLRQTNSIYAINHQNGGNYFSFIVPTAFLSTEVPNGYKYHTLEIALGTPYMGEILPSVKLVLKNGQWALYKEPTAVSFSSILWNNFGGDVYTGKNGVMLSYSANLSNVNKEISGSMKETNLIDDEIGGKIKLDGTPLKNITGAEIMYFGSSFLWIYVPNMTSYKELTVESCELFVAILPETHFALFGSEWAESFKITSIVNGEENITYCKKNGTTILGEEFYKELFNDKNVSVKLINFVVNENVYNSKQTLKVNGDIGVTVTLVGFETTEGASIRLSNPSGIRYETNINKADYEYLVSKYGKDNVEMGTYILPRKYFGLIPFDNYFADLSKTNGKDYVKIVNEGFYNSGSAVSDGYYKYYGSLVNLLPNNFCTDFFGIGYLKIKDGLNEYTIYGGNNMENYTRKVYEVAKLAYEDYAVGSMERDIIKGYLDGVVSIVSGVSDIELESINGYASPYTISYDGKTGEYTISGASEIKSVVVNGKKKTDDTTLIDIGDATYKITDYSLIATASSSTLKFKLNSTVRAKDLVDFTVEMPSDREMRILQITDTQIIDSSQMRTQDRLGEGAVKLYSRANIDKNCFNHISALIENEKPDLILFTGDIVYGEFDDSGAIWTLMIDFMDSFGIPWAPVFGNHDNETTKGVNWQCAQLESAKNCLFKQGNLTGNGNYSIGLTDESGKIRRVIYMLDSNGCVGMRGAGFGDDQIAWFKNVSASIDEAYGEDIPAFACYHIASLDFQTAFIEKYGYSADQSFNLDVNGRDGDFGQKNENLSKFNTTLEPDLKLANVDGVFIGHDHVNNYSILYNGIRYTYGTKTGTYDYYNGTINGGTVINVSENGTFEVSHRYLNAQEMNDRKSSSLTVTFMSDVHLDTNDYGGFYCTRSEEKLKKIISETKGSRFYVSLGDVVNSLDGTYNNYYKVIGAMKGANLNVYNSNGTGYTEDGRMIYNLLGNHEVAYAEKENFKDYTPYVENVGSVGVFKYEDLMFVAVDALFTRTGSDDPSDILTCTEFTIPDKVINYLKTEVQNQMDGNVKGIVWISHVALQDIDSTSKNKLLGELKGYGLPMTVFEGHTHIEKYSELKDDKTGETYCQVYTLPAVTLYENYPYYNVTFKDGVVWNIDKHNDTI